MLEFKFTLDDSNVKIKFDKLATENKTLRRRILSRVLRTAKSKIVQTKLKGQVLHKLSGELIASTKFKTFKQGDNIAGIIKEATFWSGTHEYGINKVGRKGRRLVIPARPTVAPTVQEIFSSGESEKIGQEMTEKWIQEHD